MLDATVLEAMGQRASRGVRAPRATATWRSPMPARHWRTASACSPPKLDGRMLQALAIQPGESVSRSAPAAGWFAAVLATLGRQVRSLEIHADLAEGAWANLNARGSANVVVENVDAMQLAVESQYDVIAVTGSLPVYDARFERALAVGGGCSWSSARARRWRPGWSPARPVAVVAEDLFETSIPPLLHAARPPWFEF